MEKSMDTLRQTQAKCSELEKTNKKLYSQTHTDRKEIIKLREVSRSEVPTNTQDTTVWCMCEAFCELNMLPLMLCNRTSFLDLCCTSFFLTGITSSTNTENWSQ